MAIHKVKSQAKKAVHAVKHQAHVEKEDSSKKAKKALHDKVATAVASAKIHDIEKQAVHPSKPQAKPAKKSPPSTKAHKVKKVV